MQFQRDWAKLTVMALIHFSTAISWDAFTELSLVQLNYY